MFQRDEKQKKKDQGEKRDKPGVGGGTASSIKCKTATVFTKRTVNN